MATARQQDTFFLNIDLELRSARSLRVMIDAFGDQVLVHRNDRDGELFVVWMQLSSGPDPSDIDGVVENFRILVERLPRAIRTLWDSCADRRFNMGIQSGRSPHSTEFRMSARAINTMANLRIGLTTTVYALGTLASR